MSKNENLIKEFQKLVDQIKVVFDNEPNKKKKIGHSFRLRHTLKAIDIIKNFNNKIIKGEQLNDIKGIGKGTIGRINEILEKGKLSEIKVTNNKKYLKQVEELIKVFGIGRNKAKNLIMDHNIKSIKSLKESFEMGIIELPHKIQMGLKYYKSYQKNIPRKEVQHIDKVLHNAISKVDKELFGVVCGSYRRMKPSSNDVDLLITHPNIKTKKQVRDGKTNYLKNLVKELKKKNFIIDDLTDKDYKSLYMGVCKLNKKSKVRRIDIMYIPYKSYYTALLHFTGSGDFNIRIRTEAEKQGYTLNQYGLYKKKAIKNKEVILKKVKITSEKDVFTKLGISFLEPKDRIK